jgi:hypothetical protein
MLSDDDYAWRDPGGQSRVQFTGGASPYLSVAYNAGYPTNVGLINSTVNPQTTLFMGWTDDVPDETGFRIKNIDTGAYVDTVGANEGSVSITELSVNTKYRFAVEVIGGLSAGGLSAPDSCYTAAAVLGKPTVVMAGTTPTLTPYRLIVIDTTGSSNPSYTRYALEDSILHRFVKRTALVYDTLSTTADSSNADYFTRSVWGDTVYVKYSVGHNSVFRVWGKNGQ